MLETANNPIEKVRQLQRRLWVCAKQSRTRRFHALYDRIYRSDVLWEAWKRVRSNKGAAGVDEITLRSIEKRGVTQFLEGIQAELKAGRYRPSPVKRRWIPKADGKQRPLGIPTVRDRVIQMAAKLVIEPIFEADFQPCSYGFRPKRSATQALEAIREAGNRGHNFVVDADIQGYFDGIDRSTLIELVKERISDRRVLKLIRPSPKATKRIRDRVRELTDARNSGKDVKQVIAELNPVLRGWGNYFRTGNADREFNKLDGFVFRRMTRWQYRRGGQRATHQKAWTGDQLFGMGLHRLQGTVRYPTQATSLRSSLSCVRENRMHSLKGSYMETGRR